MDNNDITSVIKKCSLFSGLDIGQIALLSSYSERRKYTRGQKVAQDNGISIVISGSLAVFSSENGKNNILNILLSGEPFGFASLYSVEGDALTVIKAREKSEVLFIPTKAIEEIAAADGGFGIKLIRILAEKVRFLNRKIDSFLSQGSEEKLMKYLLSCPRRENGSVIWEGNMSLVADKLGIARASLYRALSILSEHGIIEKNKKEIRILKADFKGDDF